MAEMKYEEALAKLEKIVSELEGPDLELENRLKKFEEGTKLARVLLKRLDQAKKKVESLVKSNAGGPVLAAVDEGEFGSDGASADSDD
jgi:exodeoxyribonuclease VII small subunit